MILRFSLRAQQDAGRTVPPSLVVPSDKGRVSIVEVCCLFCLQFLGNARAQGNSRGNGTVLGEPFKIRVQEEACIVQRGRWGVFAGLPKWIRVIGHWSFGESQYAVLFSYAERGTWMELT